MWVKGSVTERLRVIRSEKMSGSTVAGRDELRTVLDLIGKSDTLVVTRIDRLARSLGDLQDIVRELKAKGASLVATEQPINTGTAASKAASALTPTKGTMTGGVFPAFAVR